MNQKELEKIREALLIGQLIVEQKLPYNDDTKKKLSTIYHAMILIDDRLSRLQYRQFRKQKTREQ